MIRNLRLISDKKKHSSCLQFNLRSIVCTVYINGEMKSILTHMK